MGATQHSGILLPLPKQLTWNWGWVHGCSMGEEIERRDSTKGKGNAWETSQALVGIPHGDSPSHLLQIHDLWSSLRTALKTHPAHPGEISRGISKHSTLRLLGALLEEYQGICFHCTQHLPLKVSLPTASLVETSPWLWHLRVTHPGFPSPHPKSDHAPGPTHHQPQSNMGTTHDAAGNQKGPLVCLTWLGNHRPSDFTRVLHPATWSLQISWSSQDYNVSVRIWEWNGLFLSSGRKRLYWAVPPWHCQATCNSLLQRKRKWIKILVLWSGEKNQFWTSNRVCNLTLS